MSSRDRGISPLPGCGNGVFLFRFKVLYFTCRFLRFIIVCATDCVLWVFLYDHPSDVTSNQLFAVRFCVVLFCHWLLCVYSKESSYTVSIFNSLFQRTFLLSFKRRFSDYYLLLFCVSVKVHNNRFQLKLVGLLQWRVRAKYNSWLEKWPQF